MDSKKLCTHDTVTIGRVELKNQDHEDGHAEVLVYDGDTLIATVVAKVERIRGPGAGRYPAVQLRLKE